MSRGSSLALLLLLAVAAAAAQGDGDADADADLSEHGVDEWPAQSPMEHVVAQQMDVLTTLPPFATLRDTYLLTGAPVIVRTAATKKWSAAFNQIFEDDPGFVDIAEQDPKMIGVMLPDKLGERGFGPAGSTPLPGLLGEDEDGARCSMWSWSCCSC